MKEGKFDPFKTGGEFTSRHQIKTPLSQTQDDRSRSKSNSYSPERKQVNNESFHTQQKVVDFKNGQAIEEGNKRHVKEFIGIEPAQAGLPLSGGKHFPVNPDLMYGISKVP